MTDNTDNTEHVENSRNGEQSAAQLHDVLEQVKSEKMSIDDAVSHLNQHPNPTVRRQKPRFFVTTTGSVGVRGIKSGSPLILYKDQWDAITRLIQSGHLENFMEKNDSLVKKKNSSFNMSKMSEELVE